METLLAEELWQKAGVYYVRTQAMVYGFNLPLSAEFDSDTADSLYILALDGIKPTGTCRINLNDGITAKIERVVVLESYRKQGVGRLVIAAAEKELLQRGIQKIFISSRKEAVGFYEKLGYTANLSTEHFNGVFTVIDTEKTLTR
jgi:GNAT superfamily N-acetyltransferase